MPTDLALGRRRARAAALLAWRCPGSLYIYQGDELGLPEVEDLPVERPPGPDALPLRRRRPRARRLPGAAALVGRPSRRSASARRVGAVPGSRSPPTGRRSPPRPQAADPDSMLSLYRDALALRRSQPSARRRATRLARRAEPGVLAFARGGGFACLVNLGGDTVALPRDGHVLSPAARWKEGGLPADTAVWIQLPAQSLTGIPGHRKRPVPNEKE